MGLIGILGFFVLIVFAVALLLALATMIALYCSQAFVIILIKILGDSRRQHADIKFHSKATLGLLLAIQFASPILLYMPIAFVFHQFEPSWEAINIFSYAVLIYSLIGPFAWVGIVIYIYHKKLIEIENEWLNNLYFIFIYMLYSLATLINVPCAIGVFMIYQGAINYQP